MGNKSSRIRTCLLLFLIIIGLGFLWPPKVEAFSLPELFGKVKDSVVDLFSPEPPKQLTLDSKIELVPDGDVNKNGQIDAGDIVRFSFTINNPTDQKIKLGKLKTNVDRSAINFIHNVSGVTGLDDHGGTIVLPNLRVDPGVQKIISFDARVNYYQDQDKVISAQPELLDADQKMIQNSARVEIKATRVKLDQIPNAVSIKNKK